MSQNNYLVYSFKEVEADSVAEAQFLSTDPGAYSLATIQIKKHRTEDGDERIMSTGGEVRPAQLLKLLMMAPMDPDQVEEFVRIAQIRDESNQSIVYDGLVIMNKEETKDLFNFDDKSNLER
ncbi:hypothetical protein OAF65_03970 [Verrucomicrobiales bacterium]|jgi:hypothetical protein|nr:hypothetical protein [Verrucomicrobiales bacterium]